MCVDWLEERVGTILIMEKKSYNFYLWLVNQRDKNHYRWGFTPMGYVWQALVYIYGWIHFNIISCEKRRYTADNA